MTVTIRLDETVGQKTLTVKLRSSGAIIRPGPTVTIGSRLRNREMLESQTVWLSGATRNRAASEIGTLRIRAGQHGPELGEIVIELLRWLPWRVVGRYAAYEAPDRSALFAGRRAGWLPGDWNVVDADGRLVGFVRGRSLLAADGAIIGWRLPASDRRTGKFIDGAGNALVRWRDDGAGTLVEFDSALESQPFAKMVMLIAIVSAS